MNDLQYVSGECARRMKEVEKFFKPGAQVTLIVRSPGFPERDFMLTNDDLSEISAVIARRASTVALLGEGEL